MAHETHFENGEEITPYLASAYAEGFCEGEEASNEDVLRAWSYLIGTNLVNQLQGWYGRNAESLISCGFIAKDGTINRDN